MRSLQLAPVPVPNLGSVQVQHAIQNYAIAPQIVATRSGSAESLFASAGIPVTLSAPRVKDYSQALSIIDARLNELDQELAEQIFKFQNLKALQAEERRYLKILRIHLVMADKGFPVSMDMSFLSQVNDKTGMPTFAVIDLHNPVFKIEGKCDFLGEHIKSCQFPKFLPFDLQVYYQKHLERVLSEKLYPSVQGGPPSKITLETQYAGKLPDKLKQQVLNCLKMNIFNEIIVALNADKWGVTSTPHAVDPLVIGRSLHGSIFSPRLVHYSLIGVYDPTTGEEQVINNFSSTI